MKHDIRDALTLEEPENNDGNFRALLRFRIAAGDKVLKNCYLIASGNVQHMSPQVQNELLALDLLRDDLQAEVKRSSFWSLLCDETTDRAKQELLVIVVRYVSFSDGVPQVKEDPIYLTDSLKWLSNITGSKATEKEMKFPGVNIADILKDKCNQLGLDFQKCIGQGYDGASSLSSKAVGAAAIIKQDVAPSAQYFHCMMHAFNLHAAQSVTLPLIRNCMDKVRELSAFFNTSAKHHQLLQGVTEDEDSKVRNFRQLCNTRFVEWHEAIITALAILPQAEVALQKIALWDSREAISAADAMLHAVANFTFIISRQSLVKASAIM